LFFPFFHSCLPQPFSSSLPQRDPTRSVFYAMEHYGVISYSIKNTVACLFNKGRC